MIHLINKEKKSANFILKKLFQYKVKWRFRPLDRETYEKYHLEQLLNKVLGYRSYLLSIVQFNKKYHCTLEETIEKYSKIIDELDLISDRFQFRIEKLEKIIEKNKPFHRMAKVKIDSLGFTDGIKNKLKKESFKTLKDLYGVKKEKLMTIKGVGEVKAESIINIISNEVVKYI
jgi:ERCC4-type nuclease